MSGIPAIAIVLARAGSKGLAGKNWAEVGRKPCVAWSIEDALRARTVGTVAVSTDAPEVARIAGVMSVGVVDRPTELAGDAATVDDAARHAIMRIAPDAHEDTPTVILYANVPVRPAGLIDRAVELLGSTRCDSVQSYAPVGKHHPWWTARVGVGDGVVRAWEGDVLNHGVHRRQNLPAAFIPDGGVLCVTKRSLELRIEGVEPGPHAFFGRDRRGVLTGEGEVVDIDSRVDLLVADALLSEREDAPQRAQSTQRSTGEELSPRSHTELHGVQNTSATILFPTP